MVVPPNSHPLAGCRAKIARAEETLSGLARDVAAFLESPPYRIVRQHQDGGLEYAFIAYGEPRPPLRFAVLAGEIIHHLRSSLDHVVHALVLRNGRTPTLTNQFPICTTAKAFQLACDRGQIKGVGASAAGLIEAAQPFTSQAPDDTILHVVGQYDNTDKHRLLVVVATIVRLGSTVNVGVDEQILAARPERGGKPPAIVALGDPAPRELTRDGVVVFTIRLEEPAPEFTADAQFVPQVAFQQCGRIKLAPVVDTLRHLIAGTRRTVESFATEF